MTKNHNQNIFYQTDYGDTRFIAFNILKKFLEQGNIEKITDILNEELDQYCKKNELLAEDLFEKIDDEFLNQLLIGFVDNLDEINNAIENLSIENTSFYGLLLIKLIIFELKFHHENSAQNIFEDYQKIANVNQIKFDKKIFLMLLNQIRNFEMQ
ncbi:MAG: hypothetical protein ACO26G_02505 [Rickettsiales bacterium]